MNNSMMFEFEGHGVGVVLDATGQAWFDAAALCWLSGLRGRPRKILKWHIGQQYIQWFEVIDGRERTLPKAHLNLYGMSLLTGLAQNPEACRLKEWILSRVLPSIYKCVK